MAERLRFLDSMHHHSEMMKFNIGEKITSEPPGRGAQVGTLGNQGLLKYSKKSVTVITETGQEWTVAPELLSKASEKGGVKGMNVIDFK